MELVEELQLEPHWESQKKLLRESQRVPLKES